MNLDCYHGPLCQFTTTSYGLPLDALIGQRTLSHHKLTQQPFVIKFSFGVFISMTIMGLLLNTLSVITMLGPQRTLESGCSFYILYSSILGQISLFSFLAKYIHLLTSQINMTTSHLFPCVFFEYAIRVLPSICDWLNSFVSMDRAASVLFFEHFTKKRSIKLAKIIIPFLSLLICLSLLHDPLHRKIIIDPRASGRSWCVVNYNNTRLETYDVFLTLTNYIAPFACNIIAAAAILFYTARSKSVTGHAAFNVTFRKQFFLYKHIIVGPISAVLVAAPRLVFVFWFRCLTTVENWESNALLTGYLISFIPQMSSFLLYVIPSKKFKTDLKTVVRMRSK